jgi:hypothetical protein
MGNDRIMLFMGGGVGWKILVQRNEDPLPAAAGGGGGEGEGD